MPQNIGDNRVLTEGIARITPGDAARLSRYLVRTGDIVYSRRGDVERRALIRVEEDGWLCGTGCLRIRFGNSKIDPLYASYYLGHPSVREWIVRHAIGATMPNLNTSILSALPFVIPPPSEQKAIAHILGTLDDKIELDREMNKTLEAMARAIFKSWFIDFDPVRAKMEGRQPAGMDAATAELFPNEFEESALGMIPKGWRVVMLPEVADVIDCLHTKKPSDRGEGKLLLQVWNIADAGKLDLSKQYLISDEDYKLWTSRIEVQEGHCVITNVGRVGAVAQIPQGIRAAIGRNMTAIRCKPNYITPTYLIECFLSSAMRVEIERKTDSGTILDSLNVRGIEQLRLVIPSKQIMKLLDVVALLEDLPDLGLYRGQVGTIVEEYEPGVFEVEFSDSTGRAYAIETLNANQLMVLCYQPISEKTLA